MFAFIPLFIACVAFWPLYRQQFTVLTIYSNQRLGGIAIGIGALPAVASPWMLKLMRGVR